MRFQVYPRKQRKFSSAKLKRYTVCCMYDSVLLSLEERAESHDAAKAIEAKGLYHQAGVDLELNTWGGGGHLVGVVSLNECGPMILRAKIN